MCHILFQHLDGVVDPGLARDRAVGEATLARELLVGATEFALGARDLSAGGFAIDPVVGVVDPSEELPFVEEAACDELVGHLDDFAGDLGDQRALGSRGDRAVGANGEADLGRRCGDGPDVGDGLRRRPEGEFRPPSAPEIAARNAKGMSLRPRRRGW